MQNNRLMIQNNYIVNSIKNDKSDLMSPQKLDFFSVAVHVAATLFLYSQESKPVLHWT